MAAKQAVSPAASSSAAIRLRISRSGRSFQGMSSSCGSGAITSRAGRFCARQIIGDGARHRRGRRDARDSGVDLLRHGDEERDLARMVERGGTRRNEIAPMRGKPCFERLALRAAEPAAAEPGADAAEDLIARVTHGVAACRGAGLRRSAQRRHEAFAFGRRHVAHIGPARGQGQRAETAARAAHEPEHAARRRTCRAIERRTLRYIRPERQAPALRLGDSFFANSRSRHCRIILGKRDLIGQTLSQRPQKVEAFGSWPASSMPIKVGVSTAPIGPE